MRDYELVCILRPATGDGDNAAVIERVKGFIDGLGGTITKCDEWGMRKLAYPIQGLREGYYVLLVFAMQPQVTKDLERDLKLTEAVIRHLLVRQGE